MILAQIILFALGILLFVIFILPVIVMGIWNTGNYIGIAVAFICICYGIFFAKINAFLSFLWKHLWGKILLCTLSAIVLFAFVFAIVITVNIIARANVPPPKDTTVIVLGCRVREDGASTMLKTRLNATLTFLQNNPEVKCILSGGQGNDEPVSEAEYMFDWLTERKIDPSRLFVEDKSTSTEENLEFSKSVIEQEGLSPNITLVTNEFHQYRAYRFAKENGFTNIYSYSAKTPWYVFPTYFVREICGVAHMIFIK